MQGIASQHPSLNAHGDVLNAEPDSAEGRSRLVEELKSRGNTAFKSGQLDVAEVLYSKAIEHDQSIAALYGNRSMVRAKMGKFEEALADGDQAVKIDDKWSKGHFRRGKALYGCSRFLEAAAAFEQACDLAPDDKSLPKEVEAAKEAAKKKEKEDAEAPVQDFSAEWKKTPPVVPVSKPAETKKRKPASPKTTENETAKSCADGDNQVGDMKGYKILEDGRKTSFFHHEMTPEERKLLGYGADGNLAPKKITAEEAAALEKAKADQAGDSSVWAGNTWEDRKMDKWACEQLQSRLSSLQFAVPGRAEGLIKVTEVKECDSTASIYIKQDRKRKVFDLNLKVLWEATGCSEKAFEGELKFSDVLPDDVEDDDVVGQHKFVGDAPAGEAHDIASKYIVGRKAGLHAMIIEQFKEFKKEFDAL